jgi:hypothetical protein
LIKHFAKFQSKGMRRKQHMMRKYTFRLGEDLHGAFILCAVCSLHFSCCATLNISSEMMASWEPEKRY